MTATTTPTLAQCAAALPGIATGNPWTPYSNGGCGYSPSYGGSGPALTNAQQNACNIAITNATPAQCGPLGGTWMTFPAYGVSGCVPV